MKTILIARSRKTGRDVLVLDREAPLSDQKKALHAMYGPANDEFSEAVVAYVTPCSPTMKFASSEDHANRPKPPSEPIKQAKQMKKTFLSVIAILAVSISAFAQANAVVELTIPGSIAAASTTNVAQVIDVSKQSIVAVQLTFKLVSGGTNGRVVMQFSRSNDRSQWTTATTPAMFVANGTTLVSGLTNILSYGARYIRLDSIQNDEGVVVTNTAATYSLKVGTE
jgi:hypothetical protein